MIAISFILTSSLLLISAYFAGDIGYFINIDSIIIVLLGVLFILLATGKWNTFGQGILLSLLPKYERKLDPSQLKDISGFFRLLITGAIGIFYFLPISYKARI